MNKKRITKQLEKIRRLQDKKQNNTEKALRREFRRLLRELRQVIGEEFTIHANEKNLSYEVLKKSGRLEEFLHKVEMAVLLVSVSVPNLLNNRAQEAYSNSWEGLAITVGTLVQQKPYKRLASAFANITDDTLNIALTKNALFGDYKKYSKDIADEIRDKILKEMRVNIGTGADLATFSKTITDRADKAYRRAVQASRTTTHTFLEAGLGDSAKGLEAGFKAVKEYSEQLTADDLKKAKEAETIVQRASRAIKKGQPLPLLDVPNVELASPVEAKTIKAKSSAVGAAAKTQLQGIELQKLFDKESTADHKNNKTQPLPALQMYKEWRSMRDSRVRKGPRADHVNMDGTSIPVNERFHLGRGVTTDVPGNSGDPANDCRCRCILLYDLKENTST